MEPLALGYQLIPLLCFQLLTNLLVLWVTLLQPQGTKDSLQPRQEQSRAFQGSSASCSLSHTGLLNRAGTGPRALLPCQHSSLETEMETQGHPAPLPLSHLHLQIGTHGVQKTHRPHLHPLPPLHHPANKWVRSHTAKCKWVLIFFSMQDPHLFTMGETFPWLLLLPLFITVYFIVQQFLQEMPTFLSTTGEHSTKPRLGFQGEQNGSEMPGKQRTWPSTFTARA